MTLFMQYLRLLRPHQWIKNCFVFAGLIFAHAWHNVFLVQQAVMAAVAFSLIASSIYIFNDFCDRKLDQTRLETRYRVLASGAINAGNALFLALFIAVLGLTLGFYTSKITGLILISYIILNIAYSLFLKRIIIVDVLVIAAGFLLRVLAGTSGIGIPPSWWILICTFMLTLFLGFSKRRTELRYRNNLGQSKTLQGYTTVSLNSLIGFTAVASIVSYSLYTLHIDKVVNHGLHILIYTVLFVCAGIFRYCYLLVHEKNNGLDIARDLLFDRILLFTVLLWLITFLILYDAK